MVFQPQVIIPIPSLSPCADSLVVLKSPRFVGLGGFGVSTTLYPATVKNELKPATSTSW